MLAHARDPGNAGTVIRAADAAGADAVLLTGDSVDPYNGKCGARLGRQPLPPAGRRRRPGRGRPAGTAGRRAAGAGRRRRAPTSTSTRRPTPGCLDGPTAWVFGNEAWGLPEATRALADEVVQVPIHGRAET